MNNQERKLVLNDTKQMFNIIGDDKTFTLLTSDMPERLKQVVQMSWKYCMSRNNIAEHFELTPERIRQLYNRGVRRLKTNIRKAINEYEQLTILKAENEKLKAENKELQDENLIFKRRFDALSTEEKMICGQIDVLKQRIVDFDFDVRIINSLKYSDIDTMEELISLSRNDLMKLRNLGEKSVNGIEEILKKYNLKLSEKNVFRFK